MAEVIAALQVVQKPVEQEKLTMDKFELAPKFQEMLLRHKTDILTRQNEMEKSSHITVASWTLCFFKNKIIWKRIS